MKQNKKIQRALILFTLILPTLVVTSACSSNKNGGNGGPQGGPPPEAITACEGKNAGDSTSFEGREGETVESTCKEIEGQVVAVPNNPPSRK